MRSWLARSGLALLLAVPFFWRLDAEEFHGDESHWTSSGRQAFYLVTSGRLFDPQWRDEFYFYSQPQLGKLLLGGAQALAGYTGSSPIYDYDWQVPLAANRASGRVPDEGALLAARIPVALAGWVSCLLLWVIATQLGVPAAGPLAAALLASHPLWLANARRAGLDAPALCFGLAGAAAMLKAAASSRLPLAGLWWSLGGALLGLAAGTKYVGLLAALAAVPSLGWHLLTRRRWQLLPGGILALAVAGVLFFRTNPALYTDPILELRVSVNFLADQAESMRATVPTFRSPAWVAAEIVDRTIWPLGGPEVVDTTLPQPLKPGTYGTPIVALGAAVAVLVLVRARQFGPRRRTRLEDDDSSGRAQQGAVAASGGVVALATWTAAVFALLVLSVPTWWERWHLPLVPPLVLLAAAGLAAVRAPRLWAWSLVAAQYVAALAMLPVFLGRGFGALVTTPLGAIAHLGALAYALVTLVSLARQARDPGALPSSQRQENSE